MFWCVLFFKSIISLLSHSNTTFQHMIKTTFSVPGAQKPEHVMYDSNCNALREVQSCQDRWFDDVGMCVDAFHYRTKHKEGDHFCQTRCNPADYPELLNADGSWYFNSSIAEQVNVWLGGYHNIIREMLPDKYDFFLDEMVMRRNRALIQRMEETGKFPAYSPMD
jgi:hypothetical protein